MLTLGEAAGRLAVSARTVPIFTQMRYADLPADFKAWLALDHSKKQVRRKKLSSEIFECVAPGIYLQVRANKGRAR